MTDPMNSRSTDIPETENDWHAVQWLKLGGVQAVESDHYCASAG
jgi:hypothetical protein